MLIPFKNILRKYGIIPTGVFHVGASSGQERDDYLNAGVKDVIWIEGDPKVFQLLHKNLAHPKYSFMIPINECISDEDGKETVMHISNNEGQSSSLLEFEHHKIDHPEVKFVYDITVKTKRIDSILEEQLLDLADYDFLNIDLQGAELLALKGMGEELHKINYAYLEVNRKKEYKDCPLVEDIDYYMGKFGFKRVETQFAGNFGWGDALYLRK